MAHAVVSTPAVERLTARLQGVKPAGAGKWMARCPAHDDKMQSLSIKVGNDGRALMKCHAGCTNAAIVLAIGLTLSDLFVDPKPSLRLESRSDSIEVPKAQGVETRLRMVKSYDYVDANGALLFQACRYEPKTFRQRRPNEAGDWQWGLGDTQPVLYRLPEVIEGAAAGRTVFIVEGEKDVDNLVALGYCATTSPMGAGKWRDEYAPLLADADVVILPDNDDVGRAHALTIGESLAKVGARVRMVQLPNVAPKGDVSDWLASGGIAAKLNEYVALAATWRPGDPVPAPPAPPKFKLLSVADLKNLPPMEWLVGEEGAGILPAESLLAIFGAPGAGKSFIAADLACTIASRRKDPLEPTPLWFGNAIAKGTVLYVVAEGSYGFTKRVLAWQVKHQVLDHELAIGFVTEPVNLHGQEDVSHILRTVDLLAEPPKLIVFDTLARCMVGGDDNSSQDVGTVIDRCDRLRRETGASVLFVHHAKKDGDVERGSGALRAGVDTLCLTRDDEESGRVLSCEKQKDADPFDPITFYLASVGDSCVVTTQAPNASHWLTANQRKMLSALELFRTGATSTEWMRAAGVPDRSFYRVRQGLLEKHFVSESDRGRYFIQILGSNALRMQAV